MVGRGYTTAVLWSEVQEHEGCLSDVAHGAVRGRGKRWVKNHSRTASPGASASSSPTQPQQSMAWYQRSLIVVVCTYTKELARRSRVRREVSSMLHPIRGRHGVSRT